MFIHENALCASTKIGKGTSIWAFTNVLAGAEIGENCNICDGVFIENDVILGDNVTVKCGVQLWDGVTIEDDVFIGPNVTFTNDKTPRSKQYPEKFLNTLVKKGASIGANATILPGITIGLGSMIGAGAVVTQSVPPYATVVGNPARIINYNTENITIDATCKNKRVEKVISKLQNLTCALINLPSFSDMRGNLVALEHLSDLPFFPKRSFLVYGVSGDKVRGEHAHKKCEQFLIAISGTLSVVVDDGLNRSEVVLDEPNQGIYIPPGIWGVQYQFSKDAVLLVYASHSYEEDDYIRNYDDFLRHVNEE